MSDILSAGVTEEPREPVPVGPQQGTPRAPSPPPAFQQTSTPRPLPPPAFAAGTTGTRMRAQIADVLQNVENPTEHIERINAAAYIADRIGRPLGEVFRHFDFYANSYIEDRSATPQTALRAIGNEYRMGQASIQMARIAERISMDPDNQELRQQLRDVVASMPAGDALPRGLITQALKAIANQIPFMAETMLSGARGGIEGASAAVTATALFGQAGPQIALPEEFITLPAAAVIGYRMGTRGNRVVEAGRIANGLVLAGAILRAEEGGVDIDWDRARAISAGAGFLSGMIELAQLDRLFPGLDGRLGRIIQQEASRAATQRVATSLVRGAAQFTTRLGVNTGAEIVQELVQESIEQAAEDLVVAVTNRARGTDLPMTSVEEWAQLLRETAVQSALAFGPMSTIGAGMETSAVMRTRRQVRQAINGLDVNPVTSDIFSQMVASEEFARMSDREASATLSAFNEIAPIAAGEVEVAVSDGEFVAKARNTQLARVSATAGADGTLSITGVNIDSERAQAPALRAIVRQIQQQQPDARIVFDELDDNAAAIQRALEEQDPEVARIWESIDLARATEAELVESVNELTAEIEAVQETLSERTATEEELAIDGEDVAARVEELSLRRQAQQELLEMQLARIERLEAAKARYNATETRGEWQMPPEQAASLEADDSFINGLDWSQTPGTLQIRTQLESAGFSAGEIETALRLIEQRAKALGVDANRMLSTAPLQIRQGETPQMIAEGRRRGERVRAAFDPVADGRYIMWLTENATFRDVVHELAHYFRRTLTDSEVARIEKHTGTFVTADGKVNREAEERWAWMVESFMVRGEVQVEELRPLLERVAQFMRSWYRSIRDVVTLSDEMRADLESVFAGRQQEVETTTALDSTVPVQEIAVADVVLSEDVPQFKEGADAAGVVEGLSAQRYERLGTAPIVVWERTNGRLEVITGRHRLDLARRLGERTIPAQVVREADGFTAAMASTFDAEANIRDGQGSVRDYANYFRNSDITERQASSRGLLSRDKGRKGFAIGRHATDALYTLYRNNQIAQSKAAAIAEAAPNDEAAQAEGVRRARDMQADELENYVKIVASLDRTSATQQDMFGNDDAAMEQAVRLAQNVTEHRRALRAEAQTLTQALRLTGETRARILSQYGQADFDEAAIQARLTRLAVAIARWDDWTTDPELASYARAGFDGDDPAVGVAAEVEDASQAQLFSTPYFTRKQMEDWRQQIYEDDAEVARFMDYSEQERSEQTAEADALIESISQFSEQGTLYRVNGGLVQYVLLHKSFAHEKSKYRASMFDADMRPVMHSLDDSFGRLYNKADEFIRDVFSQYRPLGVVDPDTLSEQRREPQQLSLFSTAPPTNSEAFREWFGDSKVVDKSGRPLVVYHGTPDARGMDRFATTLERFGQDDPNRAYFFTPSRRTAATYADDTRAFDYQNAEPNIFSVYLSLQNPMVIDAGGVDWGRRGGPRSQESQLAEAREKGHDGVIIRNTRDTYQADARGPVTDIYIAFAPNQAKSVNNRGTWSRDDDRMLFMTDAWNGNMQNDREVAQFSTSQPAEVRGAVENMEPVTDEVLAQFANEPWAQAEVQARSSFAELRENDADLWEDARATGSVDAFIRQHPEMGNEDVLRDIYEDAHGLNINDANRQWAKALTEDDIIAIAQRPEAEAALPLRMIRLRMAKGAQPTTQQFVAARGYLRNNGTQWRRTLAEDNPIEMRRIQRQQLRAIEAGVTDESTLTERPYKRLPKIDEIRQQARAFADDPAFRSMIEGSLTAEQATEVMREYDRVLSSVASTKKQRDKAQAKRRLVRQHREYMQRLGRLATRKLPRTIDARYRVMVEEMQSAVDPQFRSAKTLKLKEKRRTWLEENPEARNVLRDSTIERIEKRSLNEWTEQELEAFVEEIQRLTTIGRNKQRIREQIFQARINDYVARIREAAPQARASRRNVLARDASLRERARREGMERYWDSLRAWAIADWADGGKASYDGPMYDLLINQANEATAAELRETARRADAVHARLSALGFKPADLARERVFGGVQRMQLQEAIGIYAANMNEQTRNYLLNGHGLTQSEIDAIIADLTDAEKDVARAIMDDYEANRERLRDAHYQVANLMMDFVDDYIPIVVVGRNYQSHREQLTMETLVRAGLKKAKPADGMTKSRVQQLRRPMRMRLDLYSTWHDQVAKQEHYINSAELVKLQDKVLSNSDVFAAMETGVGQGFTRQLRSIHDRFANPMAFRSFQPTEKKLSRLRNNAATAYLWANAVTVVKQVLSLPYMTAFVGPGYLMKGFMQTATGFTKLRDFIYEKDPYQRGRVIDRAYEELQQMVEDGAVGRIRGGIINAGMYPISLFDAIAVMSGWKGAYDRAIDRGASEQEAVRLARQAIQHTQPEGRAYAVSGIQANQSLKWFTQFSNQLSQLWANTTYDVPRGAVNGHLTRSMVSMASMAFVAYLMWALSARRAVPEDAEDVIDIVLGQFLPQIPIVGPAVMSGINGYSNEPTVLAPFTALGGALESARQLAQGEDVNLERLAWDVYEGVAIAAGIPFTQVKRAVDATELALDGEDWPKVAQQFLTGGQWYGSKEEQQREEPWR